MLAKQITSMIGRLPTPGKGWDVLNITTKVMKKMVNLSSSGLIEIPNKELEKIEGGSLLGLLAFAVVVGAGIFLGIHLADKLCNCN